MQPTDRGPPFRVLRRVRHASSTVAISLLIEPSRLGESLMSELNARELQAGNLRLAAGTQNSAFPFSREDQAGGAY